MLRSFEGVNIYTKDIAGLVKFYNEQLGIPIQFEGFGNYDGMKIGFSRNEPGIIIWDENRWGKSASGNINFIFSCDNLDSTYEELKSRGVNLTPPVTMEWGGRELSFEDPKGNKITIVDHTF